MGGNGMFIIVQVIVAVTQIFIPPASRYLNGGFFILY